MRVGLMLPAVNTVTEAVFHEGVPEEVSVHTARLFPEGTNADAVRRMIEEGVPRAAEELALVRPDLVVLACTAAGAVAGREGEQELIRSISAVTGAPVVSMNTAVRDTLRAAGASRVAVLTPYLPSVTERITASVEEAGMSVAVSASMGIDDAFEIAALSTAEIVRFADEHLAGIDFDAIFLSCGNLRATEARKLLTERYGVPVVTSNDATLEQTLTALATSVAGSA